MLAPHLKDSADDASPRQSETADLVIQMDSMSVKAVMTNSSDATEPASGAIASNLLMQLICKNIGATAQPPRDQPGKQKTLRIKNLNPIA